MIINHFWKLSGMSMALMNFSSHGFLILADVPTSSIVECISEILLVLGSIRTSNWNRGARFANQLNLGFGEALSNVPTRKFRPNAF